MKEEIKKLIKEIFKCRHKNAILNSLEGYCPDCGKRVKKSYYIIRCACCDIKRSAKKNFDEIIPQEKFCTNCGCKDYIIEKTENLNVIDVNYAIEVKETIEENSPDNDIEIWIDTNIKEKEYKNNAPIQIPILKNRYIETHV